MRLSKELQAAGVFGPHVTRHVGSWSYDESRQRGPGVASHDPISQALTRRQDAIKVTPKGWKALVNVLRLQ